MKERSLHHEDEVTCLLRERGIRVTPPRRKVLAYLRATGGHLTAQEIFDELRSAGSGLHLSSVYRALWMAEAAGLVSKFQRPGADEEYEWITEAHHHLVCSTCGDVNTLPGHVLDPIAHRALEESRFRVQVSHAAIAGICEQCDELPATP